MPAGAGCYTYSDFNICGWSQGLPRDSACDDSSACAPGLTCAFNVCVPFCDPDDATSPIYCPTLCTNYIILVDSEMNLLAGRCNPP